MPYRIVLVLIMLATAMVQAAELPLPENARPLEQPAATQGVFTVALGKPRRVDGRWQFEQEKNISGERQQTTWLLDNRTHYRDTARQVNDWIGESGAQLLYSCAGRVCGSSSVWANDLFKERRLYGPDDNQYYWAVRKANEYHMVYLIERGNRDVHLHHQRIRTQESVTQAAALILDEHCKHAQLQERLQASAAKRWLLLASAPGDEQQTVSIRLGTQCLQTLQRAWPANTFTLIGLGKYDRHWHKAAGIQFELLPLP